MEAGIICIFTEGDQVRVALVQDYGCLPMFFAEMNNEELEEVMDRGAVRRTHREGIGLGRIWIESSTFLPRYYFDSVEEVVEMAIKQEVNSVIVYRGKKSWTGFGSIKTEGMMEPYVQSSCWLEDGKGVLRAYK